MRPTSTRSGNSLPATTVRSSPSLNLINPRFNLMRVSVLAVCLALTLTGCKPDAAQVPQDVKGTINLDGKPMSTGKVYFVPSGGGPPVVTEVQAGAFALKAT